MEFVEGDVSSSSASDDDSQGWNVETVGDVGRQAQSEERSSDSDDSSQPAEEPRTKRKSRSKRRASKRRRSRQQSSSSSSPEVRRKKRTGTGAVVTKLTPYPEYGVYEEVDRLREFLDWVKVVQAAMRFAPRWTEQQKIDYFDITCGRHLTAIIDTNNLRPPPSSSKPFTKLIANVETFFRETSDATLEHQALLDCKQGPTESARDYHLRLMRLTRYRDIAPEFLKKHFITNLHDKAFVNLAVTAGWSLEKTVKAAARSEAVKAMAAKTAIKAQQGSSEVAAVSLENKARPGGIQRSRPSNQDPRGPANARPRGPCPNCGLSNHRTGVCPAIGKTCINCGTTGHFKAACRQPPKAQEGSRRPSWKKADRSKQVNAVAKPSG
jgi:hypothetical protein